jgi:hypothetical protein
MKSADQVGPVTRSGEGREGFIAARSTPRKSGDKAPAPKKVRPKKAQTKGAVPNGPAAFEKAKSLPKPGKKAPRPRDAPFNAETAQVLRDADAGKNLLSYPSLEAMFEDLGTGRFSIAC